MYRSFFFLLNKQKSFYLYFLLSIFSVKKNKNSEKEYKHMKNNQLIISEKEKVLHLQLNRPKKYNALNNSILEELNYTFKKIIHLPVNAVFISGLGENFCAGGDLNEMKLLTKEKAEQQSLFVQNTFQILQKIPIPVFSFISGICYGGGLELALHSDSRICSNTARLAMPEVKYGFIPGGGGTVLLPQMMQLGTANYHLYTGEEISLKTALEQGLIQKVIPQSEFENEIKKQTIYFNHCNRDALISLKKMSATNKNNAELYKKEATLFANLLHKNGAKQIEKKFNQKKNV